MKNICITGATGLIGGSLLKALEKENVFITAIARTLPSVEFSTKTFGRVQWIQGDLNSLSDCQELVEGQDIIFHLAHKNVPLTCDLDLPGDARLNLIPTLNLIQAIEKSGSKPHLIYPSSGGAVYGLIKNKVPVSEDHPCYPVNSYGIQKLVAEHYFRLAALRGYLTATVLRIANVYGWLVSPSRKQGLIGTALYQALAGNPVKMLGDPNNTRDYVHKDDVIRAFFACMNPCRDFDIFNIGTGVGTSVCQVIDLLEKTMNKNLDKIFQDTLEANHLSDWCVLDIDKARKEMDWYPMIDLENGIKQMVFQSE